MRLWVELCSRCGGGEGHNSQGGGSGGLHPIASKRRKKKQQQQQQLQASPEPLSAKAASASTSSSGANHIQSERYLAVSMLAVRRLARQGGSRAGRGLRGFCYDDNTGDIRSFFHFFVDAMLERERIFAQSRCHFTSSGTFLCGIASARAPPPSPWQWQVRCRPVVVVLQPPIRRKRYNEEEAEEDSSHHPGLTTSRLQSTHFALRRGVRFRSKTSNTNTADKA